MPDEDVPMYEIGGGDMLGGSKVENVDMPRDVNKGRHIIYTGGKYDSFLYVPIIPKKEEI